MDNNPQDDDLLKNLMGSMDSSGVKPSAEPAPAKPDENKTNLEIDELAVKKWYSKEKLLPKFNQLKKVVKSHWQLPFMLASVLAAAFVWFYMPKSIDEEDQIQEPEWWIQKGLHYYKIAEDKGLDHSFLTGDFSKIEFSSLSFDKQKELYEEIKQISGFPVNPYSNVQSQFLNTFVNDLNKIILDGKLIEKIPAEVLSKIDKKVLDPIKENLENSSHAAENSSSLAFFNNVKSLNRELLDIAYPLIPKNKPARTIAAKYFKYILDKFPNYFNSQNAADLLRIADTFTYVIGESTSKKQRLDMYLQAWHKNDPLNEMENDVFKGGYGESQAEKSKGEASTLSIEDQAHLEYMIANLYFDLNDTQNAAKFYKRFLDLALERSSEGFERRIEKDIKLYNIDKKSISHREIKHNKINDAYFKLGSLQFQSNKLEESKNNLEQFISKSMTSDPDKSFLANQILGDMYLNLKNYDKALNYYRKALTINGITFNQKAPTLYKMGLTFYRLGDYAGAIERLKQVNGTGEYGKYNASALFYTGKSLSHQGDDENSIEIFKRIRERYPQSDEDLAATFEISKYLFKKGWYDEAYSEPSNLGKANAEKIDFSIKTLLNNNPKDLILNNEFIVVDEILAKPDSNVSDIGLLYNLANVFSAKKEHEKVIDVYTLMTSNPLTIHQMGAKRDQLYFDMAKIWAENGALIRAGETLEMMLENVPDTPFHAQALWDICKYYMNKKDYGRAIKPLRLFAQKYYGRPESPEGYYLLGICEQKVGDFDKAIDAYHRAYGYIPWNPNKNFKELSLNEELQTDPYYELDRPENHIDKNFFAYQAIYQKGEAYRDAGLYDLAIDHIYRTVFNDPMFRFNPKSEIWKKSLLVYADSYFNKGWLEKSDVKSKNESFNIAEKSYLDYIKRYKFDVISGLGAEYEKIQRKKWEEFDKQIFDIHYNLAYIKFEEKDYEKAREYYSKITKWPMENWSESNSDERKKSAYLMLPLTYYREGKWADAIQAYRDAKDRYASSAEAPALGMRIAECLQNLGDTVNAKMEYDASIWVLELANSKLFENKPGNIDKPYWDDLIKQKKNNLDWVLQNQPQAPN